MVGIFAAYQMQLTNEAGDLDMHGDPRLLEFAASCRSRPCAEGEYSPYIPRRTFVPQHQNYWRQPVVNRVYAGVDGLLELQNGHLLGLPLCLFFQSDVALIRSGTNYCCMRDGFRKRSKDNLPSHLLLPVHDKNSAGHRRRCPAQ